MTDIKEKIAWILVENAAICERVHVCMCML